LRLEENCGELLVELRVEGGNILNIGDILNWMGLDFGRADVIREELLPQADTH